jgi:adenylate cyclase class IV
VKARVASDDIKVRVEHNVPLDLRKASPRVVHAFLKTLGFEKQVTVSKDCDIYFFKMKKPALHVSVVWYEVACKGHPNQAFVEVEVEGGTRKQKMRALHMWEAVVHAGLGLTKKDVSKDSLYEIYANQRYLIMADSNRPGRRSRK